MVTWPEDWTITTIEKVATISTGRRNKKDSNPYGKYPLYVRSPIVERIDVADYDCEAVLTAGDGEAGKVFHYVNGKFSAHQRVYVINKFRNVIGRYFYYFFSRFFIDQVKRYTAKSTVDSVRKPMIANMLIAIPPLDEQIAIADTLSTFDLHLANLSELIAKHEGIRAGALEDLLSGRTRLPGFRGEWRTTTIDDCAEILQGGTPDTKNPAYWGGNIIWVTPSEVTKLQSMYIDKSERQITQEGLKHSSATIVPAGTVLLCSRATIGDVAIAAKPLTTNQGFKNLVCRKHVNNLFFAYLLMTLKKEMITLAAGTTFLELSKSNLKTIPVTLPPVDEQIAIAETLSALDLNISNLKAEHAKISALRTAAINDLLTAKIRLPC